VLSSDSRPHCRSGIAARQWAPAEWAELVSGGFGAPWAMVLDGDRVVSICHTPPTLVSGAEAGHLDRSGVPAGAVCGSDDDRLGRPVGATCLQLFYSTSADNRSSQRVAERLGLRCIGWLWSCPTVVRDRAKKVSALLSILGRLVDER